MVIDLSMQEGKKDCRQVASRGSAELFLMILCLLVMIRIFKRNYSIRGGSARIWYLYQASGLSNGRELTI